MSARAIRIGDATVGGNHRPYVVAEMSGNHNGDLRRAIALIDAAKAAGADAVKLQTYTADSITLDSDRPEFTVKDGLWAGRRLHELYEEAHTPWDWHQPLFAHARSIGITMFSTPFDFAAVDLLESLGAPAYKIASFELVDLPLIEYAARTGKPLILSTGMADASEVREAVDAACGAGAREIVLLHCVSSYPATVGEMNLRRIPELAARFGVVCGLSDHTLTHTAAIAAVALGARLIEKHFTLARADGGVDSAFSLEKEELAELVTVVADAFQSLGDGELRPSGREVESLHFRRSLIVVEDIAAGELIQERAIRSLRPACGLKPKHLRNVVGRRASRDLRRGEPVSWDMLMNGGGKDA